ncbi:unnamed protein product [Boreogadus saida]
MEAAPCITLKLVQQEWENDTWENIPVLIERGWEAHVASSPFRARLMKSYEQISIPLTREGIMWQRHANAVESWCLCVAGWGAGGSWCQREAQSLIFHQLRQRRNESQMGAPGDCPVRACAFIVTVSEERAVNLRRKPMNQHQVK